MSRMGCLGDCCPPGNRPAVCGVALDYEALPVSDALRAALGEERARELALTGGEDYELCFTVPAGKLPELSARWPAGDFGCSRIGTLTVQPGARVQRGATVMQVSHRGFDHFG